MLHPLGNCMKLLERMLVDPFGADHEFLRRGRYGVIEVRDGQLAAIHVRRFPKIVSALEIEWLGRRRHNNSPGDRCRLYYNQPRRHGNYLRSSTSCRIATARSPRSAAPWNCWTKSRASNSRTPFSATSGTCAFPTACWRLGLRTPQATALAPQPHQAILRRLSVPTHNSHARNASASIKILARSASEEE